MQKISKGLMRFSDDGIVLHDCMIECRGMLEYDKTLTKNFCRRNCCCVVLAVDLGPKTLFNHAKQQFAQKFSMKGTTKGPLQYHSSTTNIPPPQRPSLPAATKNSANAYHPFDRNSQGTQCYSQSVQLNV
jgi:hypothetical protein